MKKSNRLKPQENHKFYRALKCNSGELKPSDFFEENGGVSGEINFNRTKPDVIRSLENYLVCNCVCSIRMKHIFSQHLFVNHEPRKKTSQFHFSLYRNILKRPIKISHAKFLKDHAVIEHPTITHIDSMA